MIKRTVTATVTVEITSDEVIENICNCNVVDLNVIVRQSLIAALAAIDPKELTKLNEFVGEESAAENVRKIRKMVDQLYPLDQGAEDDNS